MADDRISSAIINTILHNGDLMYVFYLLILLLPMLALKPRREGDAAILDARSTTCLKGIFCVFVLLHNLGLDVADTPFKGLICEYSGGIGVGLFFFLSAFGIIRSYQAKGNKYLVKLLLVNVPKLWLTAVFINAITYYFFMRGTLTGADKWLQILNLDLFNNLRHINRHGWYIASIIGLYIIFAVVYFLCSKLKTEKKYIIAGIIMAAVAVSFRLATKIAMEGGLYTREMPAFAFGCIYATFYDKINEFASKHFKLGLLISLLAFILGFAVEVEAIATYASVLIIILVSQRFTYYNKITFFLGKICIGVYLFLHFSSLVMQSFIYNEYVWVLTNTGFIMEGAVIIYAVQYGIEYVIRKIGDRISRRRNLIKEK